MGMNTASVQRLYVAYFNRPADPVSLAVYEAMLPTDRVATQAELLVIAETYFSPSAEYTTNFEGKSNAQIVDQLYQNIFGRTADAAGLVDWASKLTDGSMTVGALALQLSYSAQGTDATVVDARIEAASTFTDGLDTAEEITGYSGDAAAAEGRTYLAQISGTLPTTDEAITTQKDAAIAGVDASIAAAIAAGSSTAGSSYVLTIAVDDFTGTGGDDTFTADNTGTTNTGSSADKLNGGDGTDTLFIFSDGTVDASPALTSIENVSIYDKDDAFDISGQSISQLAIVRGEGDETFTVGSGTAVSITDVAIGTGADNAALTVAFNKSDTSASLALDGVTDKGTDGNEDVAVTGAALTTLNVTTSGSKSDFDALDVAAATTVKLEAGVDFTAPIETTGTLGTLTITGAGKATIGAIDTGFTTVDASASTGGLVATDQAGGTAITGSVSAADHINVGTLTKTKAVDLGASAGDRIEFTDDTAYTATSAQISGAEILRVAGVSSAYDLTKLDGIESIEVAATGGTVTLNKLSSAQANAVTVLNNVTTVALVLSSATGTADTATVTIDDVDTTAAAITIGDITASGVETLNIVTGDKSTITHVVSDLDGSTSVKTLNVSGAANLTITDATDMAAGGTVDATSFANDLEVGIGAGDTVLGGSGNDTVNIAFASLGNTTKVAGGAGDDTINVTGNGMDMVDADFALVTGVDNLTVASVTTASITLAGFAQGAIGTVDKNSDGMLDITATALTDSSSIDASAMILTGVDATVTLTNADGAGDATITLSGSAVNDKFTITADDTADGDSNDDIDTTVTPGNGVDIISYTATATDADDVLEVNSSATSKANADIITGWTANNAASVIDYDGTVQGTIGTDVQSSATITAAVAADATASAFVVTTDVANDGTNTQGSAFNDLLNSTASTLATNYEALEAQLVATSGALSGIITGLDAAVTASEAALIVLDNGTGSVILRLTNTTASGNTIEAGELELVGVITDAVGITALDFI